MSSSVIPATTPVSWTAVPDGSAASPSFAFQNSSGTGFYRVSANVLGISTAGVQRVVIDASGNVGVGTASPGYKLEVLGSGVGNNAVQALAQLRSSSDALSNSVEMLFTPLISGQTRTAIGGIRESATSNAALYFATNNTERMRIDSSGILTVGGSPNNYHTFLRSNSADWAAGVVNSAATNPQGLLVRYTGASPNNASNNFFLCLDTTTTRMNIYSNGGIANYSANNVNLASDERLKKDIQPLQSTWNKVKDIEVVNFRYKDCNEKDPLLYGVIAQQVQPIVPELVVTTREATETEPEYYGIREQPMYWLAIKALQEAMSRIEVLEAEIEALKAK